MANERLTRVERWHCWLSMWKRRMIPMWLSALVFTGCGGTRYFLDVVPEHGGEPPAVVRLAPGEEKKVLEFFGGLPVRVEGYYPGLIAKDESTVEIVYEDHGRWYEAVVRALRPGRTRVYPANRAGPGGLGISEAYRRDWLEQNADSTDYFIVEVAAP